MHLTPLAKKIQKILSLNPSGLTTGDLTTEIKITSPNVNIENVKKQLLKYPNHFVLSNDVWRLLALVEHEEKEREVQKIVENGESRTTGTDSPSQNMGEYVDLRDIILNNLQQDLIGPRDVKEVLEERPNSVYLGGMLYPANNQVLLSPYSNLDITKHFKLY